MTPCLLNAYYLFNVPNIQRVHQEPNLGGPQKSFSQRIALRLTTEIQLAGGSLEEKNQSKTYLVGKKKVMFWAIYGGISQTVRADCGMLPKDLGSFKDAPANSDLPKVLTTLPSARRAFF